MSGLWLPCIFTHHDSLRVQTLNSGHLMLSLYRERLVDLLEDKQVFKCGVIWCVAYSTHIFYCKMSLLCVKKCSNPRSLAHVRSLAPWGCITLFGVFLYIFRWYTVFDDRREWNRTESEQLERNMACSGGEKGRRTYRGGTRHRTRLVPRRAPWNTACPDDEKWAKSYRGRTRPGTRRVPFQTDYFILFHPGLG